MSARSRARVAGLAYLVFALLYVGGSSMVARVIRPDSPDTTIANVRDSIGFLRAGVGIELLGDIAFVGTAAALFVLLRHGGQLEAGLMLVIVAVASGVGFAQTLSQYSALTAAASSEFAGPHGAASAAVALIISRPGEAEGTALFSGLWLLPLARLLMKSGYAPRAVVALVWVAAASWLTEFAVYFFLPALAVNPALFGAGAIGELVLIGWLLIGRMKLPEGSLKGSEMRLPHNTPSASIPAG